jgi:hypothetical protein
MNYYYDLKLNFLENNYYSYEWSNNDNIEKISQIPLFIISKEDFNNIYSHNIKIDKELLNKIKIKDKFLALFCDHNNTLALEFNIDGNSIYRSNLFLNEDELVCEHSINMKKSNFNYELLDLLPQTELRINKQIKKILLTEVNYLDKENKYSKLKYLYAEWFNKEEKDLNVIKSNIYKKLEKDITDKEIEIYNLIKSSYNNV